MKNIIPSLIFCLCGQNLARASVISDESVKWWTGHSKTVSVCFADRTQESWVKSLYRPESVVLASDELMAQVSKIILSEYSAKQTGVSFVFQGRCKESDRALIDAVLFVGNERYSNYLGVTGLTGFPPSEAKGTLVPYVKIIIAEPTSFAVATHAVVRFEMSITEQIKITSLHEFGHLAGLGHEHHRREAIQDFSCKLLPKGHQRAGRDYGNPNLLKGSSTVGPYDSQSILNYCFEAYLKTTAKSELIHLSPGDQATLKSIYP